MWVYNYKFIFYNHNFNNSSVGKQPIPTAWEYTFSIPSSACCVVARAMLLNNVLISPDGSNDRSAYVCVVDLNNSRCFMLLSFLSLHPYNRQTITQGQYHFLQSLIRCHFVVKLPQRHGLLILVVRRVDDMPVP